MSSNLVVEPGSWGEFYASIEALTWKLQNSRYSQYDLASTVMVNFENDVDDLVTSAQTLLASHQARRDNVHQVNAEQLGFGLVDNFKTATVAQAGEGGHPDLFATPQGFNALASKVFADFGSSLHHQGINPISSFGSLSFLPPDVSGSFEGSGQRSGNSGGPMIIEDDGTLVGLRYGTTGTTEGLYYFYLPTAEDRIDSAGPIRTNFKYRPANLPAGSYCTDINNSDPSVLFGTIKGSATYDRFISVTNGTFDVSKHYTGYFKLSGMDDASKMGVMSTAILVGNYVYIIGMEDNGWGSNATDQPSLIIDTALLMAVWRIPLAQIVAGGAVTPEKITGWSTKDVYGQTINNNDIAIARRIMNADASTLPYVQVATTGAQSITVMNNQRRMHVAVNPNNPQQLRVVFVHTVFVAGKQTGSVHTPIAVNTLVNLDSKTAVVEDAPGAIVVSGATTSPKVTGGSVVPSTASTGAQYEGNIWPNTLVTDRGYLLTRASGNQADENAQYVKSLIMNFTNRFDAMVFKRRQTRQITFVYDPLVTGTPITNGFMKPQFLAGNGLLLTSNGYKSRNYFNYGTTKRVLLTGSPTFNYTLTSGGVVQGWAPNSSRYELPDQNTPARSQFYHIVTQVDSAGNVSSSPSVLSEAGTSFGTSIDANLKITGSITFSQSELNTVAKAACQTALGAVPSSFKGMIYVPQDTNVPLIMVTCGEVLRSDGNGYRVAISLVELNYTGARSGNITGYSVKRVVNTRVEPQQPQGCLIELAAHGGLNIYKTAAGDYLLGIGSPTSHSSYGGQYGYVWYAAIKAGAGTIEDATVKLFYHGYYPAASNPTPVAVPGFGLCVMDSATQIANATAIMVVDVMAATYDEFVTWTSKRKLVLTAQQVEQGYLVYFTAPTQVFMAGNEYTLPAGNIDLRTITANPASKTFYVYVQLVDEQVQYLITLDQLAPTITLMYIGKITTNTTQISSIAVDKRIRIETFELSATHIGSGIPITTGVPSTAGNFAWRNGYLKLMSFAMQLDYSGIVTVNLRTGAVTIEMSVSGTPPDSVSRTRTQTVWSTGETWVPGLVTVGTEASGASDAFNTYASTSKTFPALARSDIANSTGLAVMMGNESNPTNKGVFTQQPSAANDYTLKWKVTDAPGGAGEYTFDLYVKY